jgi:hypothetical protein
MSSRTFWALALATAVFGCAKSREPVVAARTTTTTTTVQAVPTAIGGGPRTDVSTDGPVRLDPARADRFVEGHKESLRNDCYAPESGVTSFIVDVTVAPDGRVEKSTVASVNGDGNVADCVRERIQKMTFPQTAEGGVHSFTFLFGR